MAGPPPDIATSTREERLAWLHTRYVCIADCDACGICASFHGKDPERALADYVDGKVDYVSCLKAARR